MSPHIEAACEAFFGEAGWRHIVSLGGRAADNHRASMARVIAAQTPATDQSVLWNISEELEEMERDLNEAENGYASDVPYWVERAKGRIKRVMNCAEAIAGHRLTAPCDEPPKGGDPAGAPGQSPASAVGEAEAPHLLHTHPNPKREDH